jgi:uncharacterized protein (TIGR02453 family)
MNGGFRGFSPDAFQFFRELAENNNKAWFDRNRARYEQHVRGAFRTLLETLEPFLLKLNPQFETAGKTNGNFSRINRDIRFSNDKSPYKSNYYLYAFDRRRERGNTGRLYAGLSAECVTVGFNIYGGGARDKESALATVFRKHFATHRAIFAKLVQRTVRARGYETYWHRQKKGEWTLHPGLPKRDEDWLTLNAWIVRKVFEAESKAVTQPSFAKRIQEIFSELYPLYIFTSVESSRWQAELRKRT